MSVVSEIIIRNIRVLLTLIILGVLFRETCGSFNRENVNENSKQAKLTNVSLRESLKAYYHSKNKTANELTLEKYNKLPKPTSSWKDYKTKKEDYFIERYKRKIDTQTNERLVHIKSKTLPNRDERNVNKIKRDLSSLWKRSLETVDEHTDSSGNLKKKHEKKRYRTDDDKNGKRNYKKFEIVKNTDKEERTGNNTDYTTNVVQQSQHEDLEKTLENRNNHSFRENVNRLRRSYFQISEKALQKNRREFKRSKRHSLFSDGYTKNATDYYEQRRKIMEKFYARQREIASKYNKKNNIPINSMDYQSTFNSRSTTPVSHDNKNPSVLVDQEITTQSYGLNDIRKFYEEPSNGLSTTTPGSFKVNLGFIPDSSSLRPIVSFERDALGYYTTPPSCTNAVLSSSFPPKTRAKKNNTLIDEHDRRGDMDVPGDVPPEISRPPNATQTWGVLSGQLIYQHNLLLGLRGNVLSTLNTTIDIFLDGPVCITYVTVHRFKQTRSRVSLENGGPGYGYVILRLEGYENEGFSYIVKIWASRKIGSHCPREMPRHD